MLSKLFLILALSLSLLLNPIVSYAATDCSGIVNLTYNNLTTDPDGNQIATTSQPVLIHAQFVDLTKYPPGSSMSILISSAGDLGTPFKQFSTQIPVVGGLVNFLFDSPLVPDFVKKLGDIPIPIANNDSESSSLIQPDGSADFSIPPLTQEGPHNVKVRPSGGDTICTDTQVIQISSDEFANVHCSADASSDSPKKCEVGGGISCNAAGYTGISTAIGCIPTDPSNLLDQLLRFMIGISGGIALLLMGVASFQMVTSQGSAEGLKEAHARFINAIIGLLFIIFATLILQLIGFTILNIPGFHP